MRQPAAQLDSTQESEAFLGLDAHRYGLSDALSGDVALLDRLLGEVLAQQEDARILDVARRLYREDDGADPHKLMERFPELRDPVLVQRLLRAYTILFQLINAAEQKEIVRVNRERQARAGGALRSESIAQAVHVLVKAGTSAQEMQALIGRLDICPTLTAHPTEARRRSVQDKLQAIAQALVERSFPAEAPRLDGPLNTAEWTAQEMSRALTALWQTDEVRATPLTAADEATNALYFFEHSIFDVVAWLHDDLRAALGRAYPGHAFDIPAFVRYRSWVGGDRDGNPNVTADLTWDTLRRLKSRVLDHYIRRVQVLRRELTQSAGLIGASNALVQSLESDRSRVALGPEVVRRYKVEPYALKLAHIETRLRAARAHVDTLGDFRRIATAPPAAAEAYSDAAQFVADLELMQRSLRANRGAIFADTGPLAHLCTQAMSFGFHLATLDVRQHSEEHAVAVEEMLATARVLPATTPYGAMTEADKVELLTRELANPRPLLPHERLRAGKAQSVLEVFEAVREAQRHLAPESVIAYVISMTHGVSDILEVLLLAKEVGLGSDIDVVPLFETIGDLEGCGDLMRALFGASAYRAHLESRGNFQEIMLGYSDSSKDGGFLAANAALYGTQARLADVCREAGVAVRFFHGRGGTVGRGGGRANRAILSQPPGSFSGRIRFTEQGEVISFRYSVPPIGHRHMEQIVSAAMIACSEKTAQPTVRDEWRAAMDEMARHSLGVYRALVHQDSEFWSFYTQATPIKYISRLPIASRPASRSRRLSGLEALRAIPWVFAWVQSRYVLPGWYGLGSALEAFAGESPAKLALLRQMYREWLFFRMVINNAQLELLRAHLPTAAWYASRVEPRALGSRIHGRIAQEHELSRAWILRLTEHRDLLEHAPAVRRTVELRNPALRPLSQLQVALLDMLDRANAEQRPAWQEAMLLSITGVAAAMQSTG